MKILVIGGSGFIGTRLCNRLLINSKFEFDILDRSIGSDFPEKTFLCDIRYPVLHPNNGSIIVNLAAEHHDNVSPITLYHDTNVIGAINTCNLARSQKCNKIIFTSSVAVYGFAPIGTDESGVIAPFGEYGRTKWDAEQVYKEWQAEDPDNRTLVIVRPTVVFGERNRGNVYNLLKQIASGKFLMVGDGLNRKSLAYVENVVAFLEYSFDFKPGIHIYNYTDKPDFTMNDLVIFVNELLGRSSAIKYRLPLFIGLLISSGFDLAAKITGKKFSISAIRVKKFCSNSVYKSSIEFSGFIPPVPLLAAMEKTIRFEFIDNHKAATLFYTE